MEYLACPHCGAGLASDGRTLRCPAGHCFDIARQGYAALLPGDAHTGTGDTAQMVAARDAFLAAGHYTPSRTRSPRPPPTRSPVHPPAAASPTWAPAPATTWRRCSTGCRAAPGAALDISRYAARRAARAHPRVGAVVCDAWRTLPLQDASATLLLNVFAPRNGPEIRRVLRPGGTLLVVSPTPDHLRELVGPLGLLSVDQDKDRRISEKLGPHLTPGERREVRWTLELARAGAEAAVAMGPSAWHTDPELLAQRLAALPDPVRVTASVTVAVYRRP